MKFPDAADVKRFCKLKWKEGDLPTGVTGLVQILGTAKISRCMKGQK